MSKTDSRQARTDLVKHRTTPIKDSIFSVPNYPTKLTIFKLSASRFWWVRYYDDGKIYKRSTKTEDKRKAIEFAKDFFNEINFKKHQGLIRGKGDSFEVCAAAVVEQQKYKVKSDDLSAESAQINVYRLNKAVLPFFSGISVKDVDYFKLQAFMNSLIDQELNPSTISDYMNLVGKVLRYAHKRRLIEGLPEIPKPKRVDNARGWFTTREYKKLWSAARSLSNKTYEIRKRVDNNGNEIVFTCERLLPNVFEQAKLKREGIKEKRLTKAQREYQDLAKKSTCLRRVVISDDMHDLIVFMVNGFIRPTDLKWMKHKHVDIVRNGFTFLRLRLPSSKKHDKPISTMHTAVIAYERLFARHKAVGLAGEEDYVFLPSYRHEENGDRDDSKDKKSREDALVQIQRQFTVVMEAAKLGDGPNDERRTLYSLRHTCIMYRLMYGDNMDLLTLATNARTSVDMIARFYASQLTGEMNIDMIQSRRARRMTKRSEPKLVKEKVN